MMDLQYYESKNKLQYESSYIKQEDGTSHGIKSTRIMTREKQMKARKKYVHSVQNYRQQPSVIFHLSNFGSSKGRKYMTRHPSMPELSNGKRSKKHYKSRNRSTDAIPRNKINLNAKYVVSEQCLKYKLNPYNLTNQTNFKVYRCQLSANVAENCNSCCCSCNSDMLFQVMKDLYDCYKSRDCENCNCILCCHLPEHDRLAEPKKSMPEIGLEAALKEVAIRGFALPEGKSSSEKRIISKIRRDLGLPPEPKNQAMRDQYTNAANAGLMLPLQGKTTDEKVKILENLADMGIPLPEGRTDSEKSLISKIKRKGGPATIKRRSSERMRRARSAGLIPASERKSKEPELTEKTLRKLAKRGLPLPRGKTESQKNLINKVRADLGLPPEPKTSFIRAKHKKAAKAGILKPLEGKTSAQKEDILLGLHDMGIPLPVGRTTTEKALIAKIAAGPVATSKSTEQMLDTSGVPSPLDGKTPAEKEKILKELAMKGALLPEAKTNSEANLINKVRTDLGLPPDPKTPSMKTKYKKAADAGLMHPLEGKSPAEKEKILRGQADMGIPLPKGRTTSEKALIDKIMEEARKPLTSLEKILKEKATGSMIRLEGKLPAEKDKILRALAMSGKPLPEGKTKSEKNLIRKIRADLGLPPEPSTASMREKHAKAAGAGFLHPLEGKSPAEKKKILRGQADMGIPLPKGRTPSEKALIAKIKEGAREPLTSLEKLSKAKEGSMTPLEGKLPAEKDKILRALAMSGKPLPEGKTKSDKNLIAKIRADLGLPPEPSTASMREKHAKAAGAGFLHPLEGKSPADKKKILQGQADMGIPLPKGRTPSEKALIAKIKEGAREPLTSQEKLSKAKEGSMTPLEGKLPAEKDKILRALAMSGKPLPEGKTKSDKDLIAKIRADLGLPPEPSTAAMREKHAKAAGAGFLHPLEGKSPAEKRKILRGQADLGIPLPIGRTPSEKELIAKIKVRTPSEKALLASLKALSSAEKLRKGKDKAAKGISERKATPSEKEMEGKIIGPPNTKSVRMRSAKAAGLLTPLEGKSPERKEKIIRGLAKAGLAIPEPKSASDKNLVNKIRAELGLPPEPKTSSLKMKYEKAHDAGIILPLEGKTPAEKEQILKRLHSAGIPLPTGRTNSEKAMLKVIKAGITKPKPSFEGMSPEKKEKLLKNLIKSGKSLPDARTPSGKELIKKIRRDMGLPPEPDNEKMKKKMREAHAKGLITPLEGKTVAQKNNILRGLAEAGIPLPEGRTPSEKSMIRKIKSEQSKKDKISAEKPKKFKDVGSSAAAEKHTEHKETSSEELLTDKAKDEAAKASSKKLLEAKAAGLLTPLTGKTPAQKMKIVRGLAEAGLPLPKGETPSEKSLIGKIRAEFGIPPLATTRSEKARIHKAKEKGLFTPLAGKSNAQKEKIIRGLAKAGLPLPEGKTATEIDLIKKVKADTSVETDKIEELDKEISVSTCERACGCEKKKIRFKHSYVRIKISSPDLAAICPCPEECLPVPKKGVFVDERGVNVVVGRAIGMTRYPRQHKNTKIDCLISNAPEIIQTNSYLSKLSTSTLQSIFDSNRTKCSLLKSIYVHHNLESAINSKSLNSIFDKPFMHSSDSEDSRNDSGQYHYKKLKDVSDHEIPTVIQGNERFKSNIISNNYKIDIATVSAHGSVDSILIIKSETSLSFNSSCEGIDTNSIFTLADGAITTNTTSFYQLLSELDLSHETVETSEFSTNGINYCIADIIARYANNLINESPVINNTKENNSTYSNKKRDDVFHVFQMSEKKLSNDKKSRSGQPVLVINQLNSEFDVTTVVDEILSKKEFCDASSLFVVVPTSDDEISSDSNPATCIQLSENHHKWKYLDDGEQYLARRRTSNTRGLRVSTKGKRFFLDGVPTITACTDKKPECSCDSQKTSKEVPPKNLCQMTTTNTNVQSHVVSTDTTQDRPCCCTPEETSHVSLVDCKDRNMLNKRVSNVSRQKAFMPANQTVSICQIPPCSGTKSCHSHEDVEPNRIPRSQLLMELKNLLNQPIVCPQKIHKLIEQIQAGDVKKPPNMKKPCRGQAKAHHKKHISHAENHSTCQIPPCSGKKTCHSPDDVLRYPITTPLSQPLMELKNLLNKPNTCPDKIQEVFEQAGNVNNTTRNVCCGRAKDQHKTQTPRKDYHSTCQIPPCSGKKTCHSPDDILRYPSTTPLSQPLMELKNLLNQPNTCPEKIQELFERAGNVENTCCSRPKGHHKKQKHTILSAQQSASSCQIPACSGKTSCHTPEDVLRYPDSTLSLSPPLMELKKLLNKPDSCPEQIQKLFDQIQSGKVKNCCAPIPAPAGCKPVKSPQAPSSRRRMQKHTILSAHQSKSSCQIPACSGKSSCHAPEDVLRYPDSTLSLSPPLMELKKLLNKPDSCPEQINELFEQIQSGNVNKPSNMKKGCAPAPAPAAYKPAHSPPAPPCPRKPKRHTILSAHQSTSSCQIPACSGKSSCHAPEDVLRYPDSTLSLSPPLMELKKLLNKPDSCPEQINELFEQIQSGNVNKPSNMKKGCAPAPAPAACKPAHSPPAPPCPRKPKRHTILSAHQSTSSCQIPACSGKSSCHTPEDVLRYPDSTLSLLPPLMELKKLLNKPDSCPEQINELFEQIQSGNVNKPSNMKKGCAPVSAPAACKPAHSPPAPPCPRKPQRHTILSAHQSTSSCQIPACTGKSSCHAPEDVLRYPDSTLLLSPPLMELKKLLNKPDSCPEQINELFEQIQTGNVKKPSNMKKGCAPAPAPAACKPAHSPPAPPCQYKTQRHTILSAQPSISSCQIPACSGKSSCHAPEDVLRYPNSTLALSPPLMELKKLLNKPDTCPEQINELFEQIQTGNVKRRTNVKNICWAPSADTSERPCPKPVAPCSPKHSPAALPPAAPCKHQTEQQAPLQGNTCQAPPSRRKKGRHSPQDVLRYPNGTSMSQHLVELKKLLNQPDSDPEIIKKLFEKAATMMYPKNTKRKSARPCPMSAASAQAAIPCQHKTQLLTLANHAMPSCQIPACSGKQGCHSPEDLLRYPYGTPMPQPLVELKKLLNKPNASPELIKALFELIPADWEDSAANMKNIGCGPLAGSTGGSCPAALNQSSPVAKPDENCPTCFKPKYKDGKKMKCACSGKKKTVKIQPLCPCEQHKQQIARTEPGLKKGTRSFACQCCICDDVAQSGGEAIRLGQTAPTCAGTPVCTGTQHGPGGITSPSMLPSFKGAKPVRRYLIPKGQFGRPNTQREMVQVEIIGPIGGSSGMSPEGIFTQAGTAQIRYSTGQGGDSNLGAVPSTTNRQNCECKGGKKGKNKCECPAKLPEPAPESESESVPQVYLIDLEDYENFMGYRTKRTKEEALLKSNLTQTTSGFKFNKKKKPPRSLDSELSDDWSIEDTVRYFVQTNPEAFRDLIPPVSDPCSCDNMKKKKKKKNCICPETPTPSKPALAPAPVPEVPKEVALEEEEGPFTGFKIMMSGKGSGSKGLSGICCFDMIQER